MLSSRTEHVLQDLEARLLLLRDNQTLYVQRAGRDFRNQAIVVCVDRACDLTAGVSATGRLELTKCVQVLSRALYETFLYSRWVIAQKNNAKRFLKDLPMADLARQFRQILDAGIVGMRATMPDGTTDDVRSGEWLDGKDKYPSFERMAREAGIEEVHTWLYGYMSMLAHGSADHLEQIIAKEMGETEQASLHDALLKADFCARHVLDTAHQWMEYRRLASPPDAAEAVLGRQPRPGEPLTWSFPGANMTSGTANHEDHW